MKGHWIENQWTGVDTESRIEVHNPATEEILDQVPSGSEDNHVRRDFRTSNPLDELQNI